MSSILTLMFYLSIGVVFAAIDRAFTNTRSDEDRTENDPTIAIIVLWPAFVLVAIIIGLVSLAHSLSRLIKILRRKGK